MVILSRNRMLFLVLGVGIVVIGYSQVWTRILNRLRENRADDAKDAKADLKPEHDSNTNITYTRIHQFLLSTPQRVMRTTPPQFLTDVKNPCFAMDENFANVGNINLSYALKMNYEIRCFPYVYLAGVEKCGTSDMHHTLLNHPLVSSFLKEDQVDEYEAMKASDEYEKHHILGRMTLVQDLEDMHLKESHFWDNIRCQTNFTMDRLSRRCTPELIIRSHLKYDNDKIKEDNYGMRGGDDLRNMVYIDSSPRTVAGHFSWNEEEIHWGAKQPVEFTPDRISHVTPGAKVIFMLRDPVARTFSDYRFLMTRESQSAEDFHRKTADAIAWWKNCTSLYKNLAAKVCAYGNAPVGLPIHNTRSCGLKGSYINFICSPYKEWGCANSIDRFRLSFYHIYLQEWLRAIPRENILFLKLEDVSDDKIGTLDRLFRFLDLPPLKPETIELIRQTKPKRKSKMLIEMLDETKTMLEEFFEPMNREVSKLLQEDFYSSS